MDIVIAHGLNELIKLKRHWEELNNSEPHNQDYYLSHSWFYGLLNCADLVPEKLYVISIFEQNKLLAIFPFCINTKRYRGIKLRTLEYIGNIYSPLRGAIYFKEKELAVANIVAEYLIGEGRDDWDLLDLIDLSKKDSLTYKLVNLINGSSEQKIHSEIGSNIISDVSQFDDSRVYFNSLSKKLRQTIRTGLNRAHKTSNLSISLTESSDENIDLIMDHYYEVYNNSWKVQEEDSTFHRNLAKYLASQGKLRIFMLYSDGEPDQDAPPLAWDSEITLKGPVIGSIPVAAIFMIVHKGTAYYLKTSYRESHAKLSVGMILFWHAVKYLIDVDNIKIVDHQKGADQYKLKWGEVYEKRYQCLVANPKKYKPRILILFEKYLAPKLKGLRKKASFKKAL